jgi:hypothetical protein
MEAVARRPGPSFRALLFRCGHVDRELISGRSHAQICQYAFLDGLALRIADLLIPFKFHECLEAMLATSTPASLGHQRSKCDFDWASAAITVEDVHCRHTKGSNLTLSQGSAAGGVAP